jgi:hypothetical protein
MKERRKFERFTLPLPVRLETITLDKNKVLDLETRDISASGTFIPTLTSFPKGTGLIMDFTIPSDNIKEFKYVKSFKGSTGTLVRSNSKGMAIHFDRECYIMSLSRS